MDRSLRTGKGETSEISAASSVTVAGMAGVAAVAALGHTWRQFLARSFDEAKVLTQSRRARM
ncbi:MAG: hypothetical protein JST68_18165 [Bacteroidetes bacterium]|nr:hypothetical protein [Bacteroidota bacterium]